MPASTGASLIGVTLRKACLTAVLKAVVPPVLPLIERSAVPPAVPCVWSQAISHRLAEPLKLALGTKRIRVELSAGKSRAAERWGPLKFSQVLPPSSVYCHFPPELLTLVTATPLSAPASTSVTPASSDETKVPAGLVLSSTTGSRLIATLVLSTGASLTGVTLRKACLTAVLKAVVPPVLPLIERSA